MLLEVIEKRVQKGNKKESVQIEVEPDEKKPTRKEREMYGTKRMNERVPYTPEEVQKNNAAIESYFAKGKGKGKGVPRVPFNLVGPPREPLDHDLMAMCRRHRACYSKAQRGSCNHPDCMYRHMTLEELKEKEQRLVEEEEATR